MAYTLAPASGDLKQGMSGPRVVDLQRRLGVPADGKFGPQTAAALKSFQKANKLPVTGVSNFKTWNALVKKGASGGGGGAKPPALGPDLENQFKHARAQISHDYSQAASSIKLDRRLSESEKGRAIASLRQEFEMRARALKERYTQMLQQQPEQFAARGLLRSGLLRQRLGEINLDQTRQLRDNKEGFVFNRGQVQSRYADTLKQLDHRLKQVKQTAEFGKKELGFSKAAKQLQLATELRTLGVPA